MIRWPRINIRLVAFGEETDKRASWVVYERLWWAFVGRRLGYVNARGRADAERKAASRWPDRRIEVHPKTPRLMPRPRIHPPGEDRLARSRSALAERGGRRLEVRLSPEATVALAAIRERDGHRTDTAAIEAAIMAAATR